MAEIAETAVRTSLSQEHCGLLPAAGMKVENRSPLVPNGAAGDYWNPLGKRMLAKAHFASELIRLMYCKPSLITIKAITVMVAK